jgi:hypothetical protein
MSFKEYLNNLLEIFIRKYKQILVETFFIWIALPVIIFGLWSIIQILLGIHNLDFNSFANYFTNAIIPWYASLIFNPLKEISKMVFICFCITNLYLFFKK